MALKEPEVQFLSMENNPGIFEKVIELLHYRLFTFGTTEFSAWYLLKLIIAIIILGWLSKRIRNVLVYRVLVRYNDDIGVRQAMGTIARYIFFVLGLFIIVH